MSSKAVYRARGAMPGARTVSAQCVHPRMGSWHEGHRLEENSPRTSRVGCSPCLTSAFLEVNTSCQDQLLKGDQERELPDDPDTFEPPLAILPLGTPAPHKPSHNPQPFLHGWGGTQRGHHVPEPCHSSHSPSCLFPGLPNARQTQKAPSESRARTGLPAFPRLQGHLPYLPIPGSGKSNPGACQPDPTAQPQPPKASTGHRTGTALPPVLCFWVTNGWAQQKAVGGLRSSSTCLPESAPGCWVTWETADDIAGEAGKLCPRCSGCHRRCQGNSGRHPAGKRGWRSGGPGDAPRLHPPSPPARGSLPCARWARALGVPIGSAPTLPRAFPLGTLPSLPGAALLGC